MMFPIFYVFILSNLFIYPVDPAPTKSMVFDTIFPKTPKDWVQRTEDIKKINEFIRSVPPTKLKIESLDLHKPLINDQIEVQSEFRTDHVPNDQSTSSDKKDQPLSIAPPTIQNDRIIQPPLSGMRKDMWDMIDDTQIPKKNINGVNSLHLFRPPTIPQSYPNIAQNYNKVRIPNKLPQSTTSKRPKEKSAGISKKARIRNYPRVPRVKNFKHQFPIPHQVLHSNNPQSQSNHEEEFDPIFMDNEISKYFNEIPGSTSPMGLDDDELFKYFDFDRLSNSDQSANHEFFNTIQTPNELQQLPSRLNHPINPNNQHLHQLINEYDPLAQPEYQEVSKKRIVESSRPKSKTEVMVPTSNKVSDQKFPVAIQPPQTPEKPANYFITSKPKPRPYHRHVHPPPKPLEPTSKRTIETVISNPITRHDTHDIKNIYTLKPIQELGSFHNILIEWNSNVLPRGDANTFLLFGKPDHDQMGIYKSMKKAVEMILYYSSQQPFTSEHDKISFAVHFLQSLYLSSGKLLSQFIEDI